MVCRIQASFGNPFMIMAIVVCFSVFTGSCSAQGAEKVMLVTLSDIHPTQPAIGFAEVNYTVAHYRQDPATLFDDFCQDSGAGKLVTFDRHSTIATPESFRCADPVGTHLNAMKSAVIAPDGHVYLTDGHHSASAYRAMVAESDFRLPLRIVADLRHLPSMAAFWHYLQQQHWVWLAGPDGNIEPQALPQQVGISFMQDDPYRSLLYFLRGIAYEKPKQAPPFLEFYLGGWLRDQLPITTADMATQRDYFALLQRAAMILTQAEPETYSVPNRASPTLKQLGQLTEVNQKKLNKLNQPGGKLGQLFNAR